MCGCRLFRSTTSGSIIKRLIVCGILGLILSPPAATAQERRAPDRQRIFGAAEVRNGDYFAVGESAVISGTVNGDVYAFAGHVMIDGTVNGDVLVAGGRVSISGIVSQDVRAAGGHIVVTGVIGRNLTVAGGNVELAPSAVVKGGVVAAGGAIDLSAPIGGAAKIAAGALTVANRLGGGLEAAVGTLRITSRAEIQGDVNYWSERQASVSDAARIDGKIVRSTPPERPDFRPTALSFFFSAWIVLLLVNFVSTLILGLLATRFLPTYHQSVVATLSRRPWASLGIGFVAAVVLPVVCALLFATVVAVPVAMILMAAFFILLYWARIFSIARLGEAVLGRFRRNPGPAAAFVVGLFIYYFLLIIPVIGWIIVPLAVLFGLGAELIARKDIYVAARRQEMI
jgi:cytoskeletal protein CcmA (bactofilin family)